jgi:hypothetical protein
MINETPFTWILSRTLDSFHRMEIISAESKVFCTLSVSSCRKQKKCVNLINRKQERVVFLPYLILDCLLLFFLITRNCMLRVILPCIDKNSWPCESMMDVDCWAFTFVRNFDKAYLHSLPSESSCLLLMWQKSRIPLPRHK